MFFFLQLRVAMERHNAINQTQQNQNETDDHAEDDNNNENPNDDKFYSDTSSSTGTSSSNKSSAKDKDFAKNFLFNMSRADARMYLSISSVVFGISLILLIKSSV